MRIPGRRRSGVGQHGLWGSPPLEVMPLYFGAPAPLGKFAKRELDLSCDFCLGPD